ncbi:hypothetical protein HELRODRAFT_194141 [Helobdella robusta]|uniref:PHD-type domain-containing protein n=1 Tax=Helobdella robusta TaxID=6412 RepID=T1FVR2_HELRO|nr:hypothetical protein HELRODRAFT_194141 [Helobdella robusta]ESN93349.1 hypothetical protein HELRODRAFT_194141 [Helobdella robusta]
MTTELAVMMSKTSNSGNNHNGQLNTTQSDTFSIESDSNGADSPKDIIEDICGKLENNTSTNNKRKLDPDTTTPVNGRKKLKNYDDDLIASSDDKGRGKRVRKPTKRSNYLDDYIDEEDEKKIEKSESCYSRVVAANKSDWRHTKDSRDKTYRPTYRHPRTNNSHNTNNKDDTTASTSNKSIVNNCKHDNDGQRNSSISISTKPQNTTKSSSLGEKVENLFENYSPNYSKPDNIITSEAVKITTCIPTTTVNGQSKILVEDISSEEYFVKHVYQRNDDNADHPLMPFNMPEQFTEEVNEVDDLEGLTIIDISLSDEEMDGRRAANDQNLKLLNLKMLKTNNSNVEENIDLIDNEDNCKIADTSFNTMTATEENSIHDLDDSSSCDFDTNNKLPTLQQSLQKTEIASPERQKNVSLASSHIPSTPAAIKSGTVERDSTSKQPTRPKKTARNRQQATKPNKRNTSRLKKDRRKNKLDDYYDEEDQINSKIVSRFVNKQPHRNSHQNNNSSKFDRRKLADNSHSALVGPYIHCKTSKDLPTICKIMNDPTETDTTLGTARYSMLSSESCSSKAASQMIANVPWKCIFCCHGSCHVTLGDLYGPYIPQQTNIMLTPNIELIKQQNTSPRLVAEISTSDKSNSGSSRKLSQKSNDKTSSQLHVLPNGLPMEMWVHGECAVWAGGVCVAGGRVKGLEEAALVALNSICCVCHQRGATVGCMVKGCSQKYHFICGKSVDCAFQEENFSLLCPKHKTKPIRTYKPVTMNHHQIYITYCNLTLLRSKFCF